MIPFAAYTAAETPSAFHWAEKQPKLPVPLGFLCPPESAPQTTSRSVHLFCTAHPCSEHIDRQTNRQTYHATCDFCCNRPHLCYACDAANNVVIHRLAQKNRAVGHSQSKRCLYTLVLTSPMQCRPILNSFTKRLSMKYITESALKIQTYIICVCRL